MSWGADLDYPDDIKVAAQRAKEALSAMTEMIFRHCTQNYTVWYTYVSGQEPDLKRAIDKMIGEGTEFSSLENAELFENFSSSLNKAREFRKPANKSTIP